MVLACAASLSAAPQLRLSTTSIGPVHVFPGLSGATQTVEADNFGTGSLNLSATVSATWLTANVALSKSCTAPALNCEAIGIVLNSAALPAGSYTGYVTVTDPNAVDSPRQITVTINVAGVPASLSYYVTPFGGPLPAAFAPVFTQAAVTGTATTQSGGNWLSFLTGGIGNFGSPYGIQVAAQNGMAPGSYQGSVALSGTNPLDVKTVNVTLNITNSPIIEPSSTPVQLSGYAGGGKPSATVSFTNIGSGTLTITGATASSSTGNFLSASVSSANTILITADPGTLAPGIYSGGVALSSNAANNSLITVPVVFTVEAAGTPSIYSGGVVNIGNFSADSASPGEILAVFGDQLATPGTLAQNPGLPPLATTLGSVQVLVNGVPAPLYFSSPGQVNFQLPYETPVGQVATVQIVSKGIAGNLRPLNVTATVPRILAWTSNIIPGGYGIVVNQDYSLVLPASTVVSGFTSHPAKAGDSITIYCAGLGQTSPLAATGAAASSSPLQKINNVTVTFGGGFQGSATTAAAFFAGLTPTAVGLYQVNATLPADVPIGAEVPVTVSVNGVLSNEVYIAVSQ